MTNKEKLKLEKKQKIKSFLFKTLHIICYILSVLFIGVLIIGGAKSCQEKRSSVVSAESIFDTLISDYSNTLVPRFSDEFQVSNPDLLTFDLRAKDLYGDADNFSVGTERYTTVTSDLNFKVVNVSDYTIRDFNSILLHFNVIEQAGGEHFWHLKHFYAYGDSSYTLVQSFDTDIYGKYRYSNYRLLFNKDFDYSSNFWLYYFYYNDYQTNFIFNINFNYNAPLNTTIQSPYGNGTFDVTNTASAYNIYNVGWFVTNGELYNQIRVWFTTSDDTYGLVDGEVKKLPNGYWVYLYTEYINSTSNLSHVVNNRVQLPFDNNGSISYYWDNSSLWKVDSYRYITFLQSTLFDLDNNLKTKINSFNNNNQSYYNGNIYSQGGDVFTLLSLGFSSLSDFWAINILPGISIGVLFFMPVIVGIIVIMFHILKK